MSMRTMRRVPGFAAGALLMATLLAVAADTGESATAGDGVRIGVVDRESVLKGYAQAKAEWEILLKESTAAQADIDKRVEALTQAKADFEKRRDSLTPEEAARQEVDIKRRFLDIQAEAETRQREIDRKRLQILKARMGEIDKAIEAVAKQRGFDLVLKTDEERTFIGYCAPALDLTEAVLERLNAPA